MLSTDSDFQAVAEAMMTAAVWADSEEGTNPDATARSVKSMKKLAQAFYAKHKALCDAVLAVEDYGWYNGSRNVLGQFGHDLYLTAVGHGVGFWDRDALPKEVRDPISKVLRDDFREWYIETWQRGRWFYVQWAGDIKK